MFLQILDMKTHNLIDIATPELRDLANRLAVDLQIKTAEELISLNTVYPDDLAQRPQIAKQELSKLLEISKQCLDADTLSALQTPAVDNPPPSALI